jgi:HEAT repeat protein
MPHLPFSRKTLSPAEETGFRHVHRANPGGIQQQAWGEACEETGFPLTLRETRFRYRPAAQQPCFDSGQILVALAAAAMLCASPAIAQTSAPADLQTHVGNLASIDYPTRMNAARMVRRVDAPVAVAALREAVAAHPDEFVRYRAFILLSSFNDRATGDLVRTLLRDRNDRLRESAYKWLELHPDPSLTSTLLAALQTEQAEFVRPALVGAIAALGDNRQVQAALVPEVTRGVDFFRGAAIDSLGRHRAAYAADAIAGVAALDGPLQDDAVLALGRIGGPRARTALAGLKGAPAALTPTIRAAQCLAGDPCDAVIKALADGSVVAEASTATVRATVSALSALVASGNRAATAALVALGDRGAAVRDQSALGFAAAAVRNPDHVIAWFEASTEPVRAAALALLRQGFEDLEEDFGEEQFFAAARAFYWKSADASPGRNLAAALIQQLEF